LLRNNRRKIELMNALLLSLPGTPIIYYGDELGMGDNIYLGDRDGVRTPMQWNGDRNAGFSRANPQRLYLPPVIDADYHYASVNVEVQQNSPHSLLWWMRRIINLRKQHLAFGRGSMEFLTPDNAKVLAFLRQYEGETMLVVANLSRFAQGAQLDLSRFRGQTPVELFGKTRFPAIGELPYFMTLGPYSFYWFRLDWHADEVPSVGIDLPFCTIADEWDALFHGRPRAVLEQVLPKYLMRQRWFAGKARPMQNLEVRDVFTVDHHHDHEPTTSPMRLLLIRIQYAEGEPETYLMPVVFAQGEQAANITRDHPRGGILRVERSDAENSAVLCEAMWEEQFWQPLFGAMDHKRVLKGLHGEIVTEHTQAFRRLTSEMEKLPDSNNPASVQVFGGQQSNTSVVLGNRLIMKVFRRLSPGENPDLEIGRFFTHDTQLDCVPEIAGALVYHPTPNESSDGSALPNPQSITLGILHEYVPNEGDAWRYTLDELGRFMERVEAHEDTTSKPELGMGARSLVELAGLDPPEAARELIGGYLHSARLLGTRTAEMHAALASGKQPAFRPEPFSQLYQRSLYQSMRMQTRRTFHLLRRQAKTMPDDLRADAEQVAGLEDAILERFGELLRAKLHAVRTRCHGDYHLGQVLYTGKDFVIIDFEGEPERPVSERKIKASPLRDVAGMLRSFHYASHAALRGEAPSAMVHGQSVARVEAWMQVWNRWTSATFLQSYLNEAQQHHFLPKDREELRIVLDAYLLEKALYELTYELNNRPDWIRIPFEGIFQLVEPNHVELRG
jgi:maltose alpha-D-glucosyltransferase/alpha-amylase